MSTPAAPQYVSGSFLILQELSIPIRADTIVAENLDRIIRSLDVFEHQPRYLGPLRHATRS
jgi:hypothetical protein